MINLKKKNVYLFGHGDFADKIYKKYNKKLNIIGVLDNDPKLQNTFTTYKLKIFSPKIIKNNKKVFVIITTTSFSSVIDQLLRYDFPKKKIIISPYAKARYDIIQFQKLEGQILFTSGSTEKNAGGLYQLSFSKKNKKIIKIINGASYSVITKDNKYFLTHLDRGLIKLDSNFKVLKTLKLDQAARPHSAARPHGITYSEYDKCFYVALTYPDKILKVDKNLNKILREIQINKKISNEKNKSNHHCNDIVAFKKKLYLSVFSLSGKFGSNDKLDGGIFEFDISKNYKKKILKKKLLMPHNIKIINKKLSVCDSLRGRVLFDNFLKKSNFLGFTRGLDFKQNLYFIGQSINRNGSRYNFLDNSISADPGIIIFDNKTRFNKLIMLNSNITDIHSIIVKKFKIVKNKSHKLINNKIGSIT